MKTIQAYPERLQNSIGINIHERYSIQADETCDILIQMLSLISETCLTL